MLLSRWYAPACEDMVEFFALKMFAGIVLNRRWRVGIIRRLAIFGQIRQSRRR